MKYTYIVVFEADDDEDAKGQVADAEFGVGFHQIESEKVLREDGSEL